MLQSEAELDKYLAKVDPALPYFKLPQRESASEIDDILNEGQVPEQGKVELSVSVKIQQARAMQTFQYLRTGLFNSPSKLDSLNGKTDVSSEAGTRRDVTLMQLNDVLENVITKSDTMNYVLEKERRVSASVVEEYFGKKVAPQIDINEVDIDTAQSVFCESPRPAPVDVDLTVSETHRKVSETLWEDLRNSINKVDNSSADDVMYSKGSINSKVSFGGGSMVINGGNISSPDLATTDLSFIKSEPDGKPACQYSGSNVASQTFAVPVSDPTCLNTLNGLITDIAVKQEPPFMDISHLSGSDHTPAPTMDHTVSCRQSPILVSQTSIPGVVPNSVRKPFSAANLQLKMDPKYFMPGGMPPTPPSSHPGSPEQENSRKTPPPPPYPGHLMRTNAPLPTPPVLTTILPNLAPRRGTEPKPNQKTHPGCSTIKYNRKNNPELEKRRVHFCDFPGKSLISAKKTHL